MNGHISEDDLYALALGDATGAAEAQAHLRQCAECARALAETQIALSALSLALPEDSLPSNADQRFLAKLSQAQEAAVPARSSVVAPVRARATWRIPFAVACAAACALVVLVLSLSSQNAKMSAQLHSISDENRVLEAQRAQGARAVALLSSLTASDTAKFVLTAADAKPVPQVHAFYRRSTGQVMMTATAMRQLPAGKTYELWLLTAEKPIPAGTFSPDNSGSVGMMVHMLPGDLAVKGFGVTMEDAKGSETPTLPILLASK